MALKDIWKDKIDGIDDVLAEDINSIAQAVIQSEEKIAIQETAINGKVDKITETTGMWAYTQEQGTPNKRRLVTSPSPWTIPLYNTNKNLATNTPVADDDATPKGWAEENFVPIYTAYPGKLYGTGGFVGKVTQRIYSMSHVGITTGDVLNFLTATSTSFDKTEPTCTIGVCDPIKPIQVANKRYVDRKCRDLQQGVYNALGVLYTFESVKLGSPYNEIPDRALSIAYLESIGGANVYSNATGEPVLVGTTDILAIHIYDANGERLSVFDPTAPQYIKLPEGAVSIVFEYREPTVSMWDMLEIDASIKYQIKVGA